MVKSRDCRSAMLYSSLAALSCQAYAVAPEPINLDKIVVSATRSTESVKDTPADVSIVTAEAIGKRSILTVDEALNTLPGLFVRRGKGLADTQAKVTLRGMPGQNRTLFLVDGVRQNDGYTGEVNFNSMDLDNIERIEVVRGPFSSLYGGSAMGGVINVITKIPEETALTMKIGYGNGWKDGDAQDALTKASLSGSIRVTDALGLGISYQRIGTDGYPNNLVTRTSEPPAEVTGWSLTESPTGSTRYIIGDKGDNAYWADTLAVRAYYTIDAHSSVSARIAKSRSEYSYDDPHTYLRDTATGDPVYAVGSIKEGSFLSGPGHVEQTDISATWQMELDGVDSTLSAGYMNQDTNWYITPSSTSATRSGGPGTISNTPNSVKSLDWQFAFPVGLRHTVTAGLSWSMSEARNQEFGLSDWLDEDTKTSLTYEAKGKERTYALFVQDVYDLTDELAFYAGVRFDRWTTFDGMSNQVGSAGNPTWYDDRSKTAVSPKLSAVYRPSDATAYRASVGRSFRAPTTYELYRTWVSSSGVSYASNPNLNPETTTSWELGIDHTFFPELSLAATYFNNSMKDFVYRHTITSTLKQYENAARASSRGVEVQMNGTVASSLNWFANYTYTDAKIDRNPAVPDSEGKKIPMIPESTFNIGADWQYGRTTVGGTVRYVSDLFGSDDNSDTVDHVYGAYDGYTLVDVRVAYQITEQLTVSFAVNNLLDEDYYIYYKAPGRSWFAEVAAKF